jgi:hypothetical protein
VLTYRALQSIVVPYVSTATNAMRASSQVRPAGQDGRDRDRTGIGLGVGLGEGLTSHLPASRLTVARPTATDPK